jgi:hypothetical protein
MTASALYCRRVATRRLALLASLSFTASSAVLPTKNSPPPAEQIYDAAMFLI